MPSVPKPSQKKASKVASITKGKPRKAASSAKEKKGRSARHPGIALPKDGHSLSLKETSAQLGVTVRKVVWLAGKGQLIAHVSDGKTCGIDPQSVKDYEAKHKQPKGAKPAAA